MTRGSGLIGFIARRVRTGTGLAGAEQGTTLVELMVAITLFVIVLGGALMGFSGGFRLTRDDRSRSVAANLASEQMDAVRAKAQQDFSSIPIGVVLSSQSVDGETYSIRRRDRWITSNPNSGPCDSASGSQLTEMSVRVSVTWPNMAGTSAVTSQTVLTPPAGTFDPETGHIGAKVLDQTGAGVQNVPVTAVGPGYSDTEITQSDGCAFFEFLDPATYTVTASMSGYVSDQGVASPSQTVTVTVGTISSIQFNYAQSATLALTLGATYGGAIPSTLAVTLGNTHLLPIGTKIFPGSGPARTLPNQYPFTDGYQAWAGDCLDADPQAQKTDGSGPFYPGGTRAPAIGVQPGQSSSGTVALDGANITVTKGGIGQVGLTVVATHAADTGCPQGESYTLGVTGTGGVLAASLPYGLWTLSVSGKSPSGSWPTGTLSPVDGHATTVTVTIQ